jgi:hypothetical protein
MAGYIDFKIKKQLATGNATSTSSSKLLCTNSAFVTQGVEIGDIVFNITDPEFYTVTAVDSEISLSVDGSAISMGDAFVIMKPNETESFPIRIDDINRVQSEYIFGETRIVLSMKTGTATNAEIRIILKDEVTSVVARGLIVDQFMRDVNNALSSGYLPSSRDVSALPSGNEYMYAYATSA